MNRTIAALAPVLWPLSALGQTQPTQAEVDALKASVEALERANLEAQKRQRMVDTVNSAGPVGPMPYVYVPPPEEPKSPW